jgi:hypothetical protein
VPLFIVELKDSDLLDKIIFRKTLFDPGFERDTDFYRSPYFNKHFSRILFLGTHLKTPAGMAGVLL